MAEPIPKDITARQTTALNLKVAELRARCESVLGTAKRTPDSFQLVLGLMKEAKALDVEYVEWAENIPSYWQPTTVEWIEQEPNVDLVYSVTHPGKVDKYLDICLASVWNIARVSRLFLSIVTLRCSAWLCAPADYRLLPEYAEAARMNAMLIEDVIASVPYFFGWRSKNDTGAVNNLLGYVCGDDDGGPAKGLSGLFLLWPLVACASSDFATESQRLYLKGRLQYIANYSGVFQAALWADVNIIPILTFILRLTLT